MDALEDSGVLPAMHKELLIPFYAQADWYPERALGSRVWDENGRDYIDLAGGIAVCSLGHSHPELCRILSLQAEKLWHISNLYATRPAVALAEALTEATFAERVFFANSGAEAMEAAVKIARRYAFLRGDEERNRILCCSGAFHGRTLLTIAMGDRESHRQGCGPLPSGIERIAFNDPDALDTLDATLGKQLAAVVVEPVQGEAGVIPASLEFLRGLRAFCDRSGSLLIFDEVQSGNGRTGELFAYMKSGVVPDILATAKGLANGLPLGVVLTRKAIADAMTIGSHGSTFGGNPLACAVAHRTLEIIRTDAIRKNVEERADQLARGLKDISHSTGLFREIRQCGLWVGAQLKDTGGDRLEKLLHECILQGVMALPAGNHNTLRLAPALNITEEEMATGLARLEQALKNAGVK